MATRFGFSSGVGGGVRRETISRSRSGNDGGPSGWAGYAPAYLKYQSCLIKNSQSSKTQISRSSWLHPHAGIAAEQLDGVTPRRRIRGAAERLYLDLSICRRLARCARPVGGGLLAAADLAVTHASADQRCLGPLPLVRQLHCLTNTSSSMKFVKL